MSLLFKHFDEMFGFEEWKRLTNPDVYLLKFNDEKFHIDDAGRNNCLK